MRRKPSWKRVGDEKIEERLVELHKKDTNDEDERATVAIAMLFLLMVVLIGFFVIAKAHG